MKIHAQEMTSQEMNLSIVSNLPLNDHLPFLKTIWLPWLSVFSTLTLKQRKYEIIRILYAFNFSAIVIITRIG